MSESNDIRISVSAASIRTHGSQLVMRGWCMPPATELQVLLPSGRIILADVGLIRDDVAKQLGRPDDRHCGWFLTATAPEIAADGSAADVKAVFADGSEYSVATVIEQFDDNALSSCSLLRIEKAAGARDQEAGRTFEDLLKVIRDQRTIPLAEKSIDLREFEKFCKKSDYEGRYASYVSQFKKNLRSKQMEHFLSLQSVNVNGTGIYLNAAASSSPFSDISVRGGSAKSCYQQDMNYQPGRTKNRIGSNSRTIPLPRQSLDGIFLHNAWQHFEGMSDFATLIEARRLLRPGGQICIIPIMLRSRMEIVTSPSAWYTKSRLTPEEPAFDPRCTLVIDESVVQRQIKYYDPENLLQELALVEGMSFEFIYFENYKEAKFTPLALVGTRLG
ncbi:methyltransferase domain-containing protein [Humitalea sp. 24SJ18S-53]|uniref:methyltransferase domain-containing protein n=1 Tax=Humitalea sp. 24SJ18S-53 TaxID=3422307 RepID=UPI003D67E049